ncbi:MAG TPA: restriction endonuclease [Lachnospiraceae bacterium]|nr:restriction endonuclease [Lachnospiraceae bacterium]
MPLEFKVAALSVICIPAIFYLLILFIRWVRRRCYLNSDIGRIDMMSGAEFEEYLYKKLISFGVNVQKTPLTKDFGADLIITLEDGFKIAVQAKRYEEKVGLSAVQEVVASLAYYDCDRGLVITNSEYTDNTRILADVNKVILWDRDDLIRIFIDGIWQGV